MENYQDFRFHWQRMPGCNTKLEVFVTSNSDDKSVDFIILLAKKLNEAIHKTAIPKNYLNLSPLRVETGPDFRFMINTHVGYENLQMKVDMRQLIKSLEDAGFERSPTNFKKKNSAGAYGFQHVPPIKAKA